MRALLIAEKQEYRHSASGKVKILEIAVFQPAFGQFHFNADRYIAAQAIAQQGTAISRPCQWRLSIIISAIKIVVQRGRATSNMPPESDWATAGQAAPSEARARARNCREIYKWCGRRDLNPHALRHKNLNLACLPISPRPHRTEWKSSIA